MRRDQQFQVRASSIKLEHTSRIKVVGRNKHNHLRLVPTDNMNHQRIRYRMYISRDHMPEVFHNTASLPRFNLAKESETNSYPTALLRDLQRGSEALA